MNLFSTRQTQRTQNLHKVAQFALIAAIALSALGLMLPIRASAAFADEKAYVLLAPIPGTYNEGSCAPGTMNSYNRSGPASGNGASTINCTTDFVTYLKGFFRLVISLSSIIAVLVITFEGFKLVVSVSEGARATAKSRIEQALIGLGLVLGSYLILNTINPQLTKISFVVDKVSDAGLTGSSAFLQDGLSAEIAAEQLRLENRAANEAFSREATPLMQELESLGDCSLNPEPSECYTRQAELEHQIQEAKNNNDVLAYTNGFRDKINTEVLTRIKAPVSDANLRAAREQLASAWMTAMDRVSMLRNQGRDAEANTLLLEAQKIYQDTSAAIDHRAAYPNGDRGESGDYGGGI